MHCGLTDVCEQICTRFGSMIVWKFLHEILTTEVSLVTKLQESEGVELVPYLAQASGGSQQVVSNREAAMICLSAIPPYLAEARAFLSCLSGIHMVQKEQIRVGCWRSERETEKRREKEREKKGKKGKKGKKQRRNREETEKKQEREKCTL